jgi:hypothetical protein
MRTIFLGLLLVATGCRTQVPVYNVDSARIEASSIKPKPTLDEVGLTIQRAGTSLGWLMESVKPGHILGTLQVRTHVASVDIRYNTTAYSIHYKASNNLGYDGETIHPNYNGWIKRLSSAIHAEMLKL